MIKVKSEVYGNDEGYTDEVGGYHVAGTGYSPSGSYCGECCSSTCKDCVSFKVEESPLPSSVREFITSRFSKRS